MKIVVDSSANLLNMPQSNFSSVALKIITDEKEYTDDCNLDVAQMTAEFKEYSGKSSTACPGVGDWLKAFADEDKILGAALTSNLSGCYNAAMIAAEQYQEEHPDSRVFILDSLTTGPELALIAEKYEELILSGLGFDHIVKEIEQYRRRTSLAFMLGSLDNFAKNGRVKPALAKLTGLMNIRIVGRASIMGDLEPLNKCRGDKGSMEQIWKNMQEAGYRGGKVRITHTDNKASADRLFRMISSFYPNADIQIGENRGICAFYAESGGILVGFEGDYR